MIKVLISMNDIKFAKQVERMVMNFFVCKCGAVADFIMPSELEQMIADQGFEYDVAILGLDQGECKDIITYGNKINDLFPPCQIIYIAENNKYLNMAYDTFHVYYVLKDLVMEQMPKALGKAYKVIEKFSAHYLVCNSQHKMVKIYMDDIYYIERERHISNIYTENNCYKIKETLNKLAHTLEVYAPIIRCHVSYYINLQHVISYQSTEFMLRSGRIIPISRKYNKEVKDVIQARTGEQKRYVTFPF